jgi:hypothetical protein
VVRHCIPDDRDAAFFAELILLGSQRELAKHRAPASCTRSAPATWNVNADRTPPTGDPASADPVANNVLFGVAQAVTLSARRAWRTSPDHSPRINGATDNVAVWQGEVATLRRWSAPCRAGHC